MGTRQLPLSRELQEAPGLPRPVCLVSPGNSGGLDTQRSWGPGVKIAGLQRELGGSGESAPLGHRQVPEGR